MGKEKEPKLETTDEKDIKKPPPKRRASTSSDPEPKRRQYNTWKPDEDAALLAAIDDALGGKWNEIASKVEGRNAGQCKARFAGMVKRAKGEKKGKEE